MNGKPVLFRENSRTVLTLDSEEFHEKLLCDGIVMNLGDACVFNCGFCYVQGVMLRIDKPVLDAYNDAQGLTGDARLGFQDVVIRRKNPISLLKEQLRKRDGSPAFPDPTDRRVVYSSTVVDVAANMELLRETAEACNLILEQTRWQIRLLSKSNLLHRLIADKLIPEQHHQRIIFGVSTGTLDDQVARAFEEGTALVSKRLESLHWLQDRGLRTFGMICPSLPQDDYELFSREICQAIRVDKCEHVWAEVINVRGKSLTRTMEGLQDQGHNEEAERLESVSGAGNGHHWEEYARATFDAHTTNIPPEKLRFLQYVTVESADWWADRRGQGAVLLGKIAKIRNLTAIADDNVVSAPLRLSETDIAYREAREQLITEGVRASIKASKALHEIFSYRDGILWQVEFKTFEAYCSARWGYAKSHAYRLKDCGQFIHDLESRSPKGELMPLNESQIRPILQLEAQHRVECWKQIAAETPVEDLTGALVARKIRVHAEKQGISIRGSRSAPPSAEQAAKSALARLERSVESLPKAGLIKPLLRQIESIIG